MHRHFQKLCWLVASLVAAVSTSAFAGGGPENLILVVNARSEDSKTVANHYAKLRNIPAGNLVYLDYPGTWELCNGEEFRTQILEPTLEQIDDRRLGGQIDYIVYSTGFPWRVEMQKELPEAVGRAQQKPVCSLTGVTYLWRHAMAKSYGVVSLDVNWYVPGEGTTNIAKCQRLEGVKSQGFRSRYAWEPGARRGAEGPNAQKYMLSTMLGVNVGRGNTIDEVLSYLRAAVQTDSTPPQGAFYFCRNTDVRSGARHACFDAVAAQLRATGAKVEVQQSVVPQGAAGVLGMCTGGADLKLEGQRIMPGAICDNLTSSGGELFKSTGQTPLTAFLRLGAAGASGTVTEPYAIQAKFPLPSIHLHYRRGCSLAEAYYQSVAGPYQLLIVGDALCQPWAKRPKVEVLGARAGQTVRGPLTLTVSVAPSDIARPPMCDLFVDGLLRSRIPAGKPVSMDTKNLSEGWHELRLVSASADSIESQGRAVLPIVVDNDPAVGAVLAVSPADRLGRESKLKIVMAESPPGRARVYQNSRQIGVISPEEPELTLRAGDLGRGPARLHAVCETGGVVTAPVWVDVQ